MARWLNLLLTLSLLTGCRAPLRTEPFVSPVSATQRLYVPLALGAYTNKLGLGGCPDSCAMFGCRWCYSWTPTPGVGRDHERVAMLWGAADVGRAIDGNSAWLMGFNEPDLANQANLTPVVAAIQWHTIERIYPTRRLVAPAPSHIHPEWLPQFYAAYTDIYGRPPRLDALAFHCYFPASDCIRLGKQFVAWAQTWNVPEVWCTEFAFLPAWRAQAEQEARRFVDWLEAEPLVTRYAPFANHVAGGEWYWPYTAAGTNPSVFEADGMTLTEIGAWYQKAW